MKMISDVLSKSGFQIVDEGLKVMWNPDEESIVKCFEYGKEIFGKFTI